jgi:hypothetical protein
VDQAAVVVDEPNRAVQVLLVRVIVVGPVLAITVAAAAVKVPLVQRQMVVMVTQPVYLVHP